MELMFFQLQNVDLTKQQETKYLNIVLEQELKDTEQFKQDELVSILGLNASRCLLIFDVINSYVLSGAYLGPRQSSKMELLCNIS